MADFGSKPRRYYFRGTPTTVGVSSTAEAVIAELEVGGDGDLVGDDRVDFDFAALSPTANGSDTHRIRVRLGSLTGPVVADTGAVDVAENAVAVGRGHLKVITPGIAGVASVAGGGIAGYDAAAVSAGYKGDASAQYATKGAPLKLVLTGQAGASNAGNSMTALDLAARVWRAYGTA